MPSIVIFQNNLPLLNVSTFVLIVMFRSMLSVLLLCSTTICISSCMKNSFHALVYSALNSRESEITFLSEYILRRKEFLDKAWIEQFPVHQIDLLIEGAQYDTLLLISLIYVYIYASPLYLSMYDTLRDIYNIWTVIAGVSIVISVYVFDGDPMPVIPDAEISYAKFLGWTSETDASVPDSDTRVYEDMVFHAILQYE